MTNDEMLANCREEMTRVLAERDVLQAAVERVEGLAKYYDSKSEETWRNPSAAISYDFDIIAIQIRDALSAPVPSPEGRDTHTDGSAPTTPPRASQGAGAEVTAADRERAAEVLFGRIPDDHPVTRPDRMRIARVAAALADERAKARAPFLRVMEDMARDVVTEPDGTPATLHSAFLFDAASRIRRAAENPS
jgi:hypothetical protein